MHRLALSLLSFSRLIPSLNCFAIIQYHLPKRVGHFSTLSTKLASYNSYQDMTIDSSQMEETLFGLLGCVVDKPDIPSALNALKSVLGTDSTNMEKEDD